MSLPGAEPPAPQASAAVAPLSSTEAVLALHDYAALHIHGDAVYGVRYDPASGANRLCRFDTPAADAPDSGVRTLLPDGFSVRSRVHEYGGGAWCIAGGEACFANDADQQIWRVSLSGGAPQPLTHTPDCRYGDLHSDPRHQRQLAISETHFPDREPVNRLVAIDPYGRVMTLAEGADFYSSPALSPDGSQLAWIEWDHPQQPWRVTRLCLAQVKPDGGVQSVRVISDCAAAWAQPRFSPDGTLHAVVDRDNWWRIERFSGTAFEPLPGVAPDQAEFTTAPWQFGLSTYGWGGRGELLAIGQQQGVSRLYRHDGAQWCPMALDSDVTRLHSLRVAGSQIACVAEFNDRLPAVVRLQSSHASNVLRLECLVGGQAPSYPVSRPQVCHAALPGEERVPYFLYSPEGSAGGGSSLLCPLVIYTHGGPTAVTAPGFRPAVQYWTQRGFRVADVNYRGSTGYGRDFRLALAGQWGISDVEDVAAVATDLIRQGLADPAAIFIRGNSAGGYTTLSALCRSDLFRAGASLYGVSDPARLNQITHKFESRYLHWLIGDPQQEAERYAERSPLNNADQISVPVIFFQGERDPVVLPEQTRQMVERLVANGVRVEALYFPEEGHGFRRAAHQALVLEREFEFYRALLEKNG